MQAAGLENVGHRALVLSLGFRVSGVGCRISGFECRVSGVGCRVSGFWCGIQKADVGPSDLVSESLTFGVTNLHSLTLNPEP